MLGKCDDSTRDKDDHDLVPPQLPRIPLPPRRDTSKRGVYFILEKASLVPACVGKKYQILNPDEHADFLQKKNMNPYDFRPKIVHEALRLIVSSQLRVAGRLHVVFIRIDEGILIRVEPQTQIPITLRSFCNMMGLSFSSPKAVQLKDCVSDANCNENLVSVVGAMTHEKIDVDHIDDFISVSGYPLSAGTCLRRICLALEKKWCIH